MITALTPIARQALLGYHGQGLLSSVGMVAELALGETFYANDAKGRIIENYIITGLELAKRFQTKLVVS